VRALPLKSLGSFIWNRSFQNVDVSQIYQLSMSAHRLESWHVESNPYDRFVVFFLAAPKFNTLPTADQLSDFYDLTRAEARLVIALMEGKNVEAAAAHLHVSVNTIRSHLRAIYSKLGTDNKADLLRIISMTLVGYSTRKS
jgi:DNA-binding NarL/FixJ family response regulator